MTFFKWSRTAAGNSGADSTINYAEGQSPGSLNDSARAAMAASAKFRDDISGALVTGGMSTAYTLTSYQVFDSLLNMDGKMIAFTPHATNTAGSPNVTLNVDGLGAKTIRADPNSELVAGVLVAGTPYTAVYSNSTGIFYLRGFYGNPYNIPIGASVDFWGSTVPNSAFALCYGQAISRTTYGALFSLFGTTYGVGDGSTTFNVPDLRGRVIAGRDDMGGTAASRLTISYFGSSGATLGAANGAEFHVLSISEMPAHTHANTLIDPGHSHNLNSNPAYAGQGTAFWQTGGPAPASSANAFQLLINSAATNVTINNASAGSGSAHAIVQPTIIANKLLRIM